MAYKNILVGLCGRGDENIVIKAAMEFSDGGHITFMHVSDPHAGEMSMMMDSGGPRLDEEDIREQFRANGFEDTEKAIEVRILKSDNIPQILAEQTKEADLLILGHRRMSTFKSNIMDSVDEGIVNHAKCPVLVVPK